MHAFIYIIHVADLNHSGWMFKIGTTTNFKRRLQTLQTSCPYKIEVANLFKVPKDIAHSKEREFHAALSDFHVQGEWFKPGFGSVLGPLISDLLEMEGVSMV